MDLSFLHREKKLISRGINEFQSLFLWIFRSYLLAIINILMIQILVSILVLMDLSFLQIVLYPNKEYDIEFQSLFLWIFRSYAPKKADKEVKEETFQSLFLWIFRSYPLKSAGINQNPAVVSILVLMDLSFLHEENYYNVNGYWIVSILVLMDLSFLQINALRNVAKNDCFNPCSYGSFVLTGLMQSTITVLNLSFNPCSYGSSVLT